MTDLFNPSGIKELFEPTCRVKVSGEHFFSDPKLYTNIYGISFFSSPEEYASNPYLPSSLSGMPSIIDDFLSDGLPFADSRMNQGYSLRKLAMQNVDKKYLRSPAVKKADDFGKKLSCSCLGDFSFNGHGTFTLTYGTIIPATVCVTGDAVSMMLPFSPFPNISFVKGKRTMQSVDYPIRTSPFLPPEDITIDFTTYASEVLFELRSDMTGIISVEYYLEVGASKCENGKFDIIVYPFLTTDKNTPPFD